MASRINNLKPPCGYVQSGIIALALLDWEDFGGFGFNGDDLYNNCLVTDIEALGAYADVQADTAKYTSAFNGKQITHSIDTFVAELSAAMLANLQLASKRRFIPVFTLPGGKSFTFGYEAGAAVIYGGQTDGAIGATVTISAPSIYPLFEVTAEALAGVKPAFTWLVDFATGAYCEVQ